MGSLEDIREQDLDWKSSEAPVFRKEPPRPLVVDGNSCFGKARERLNYRLSARSPSDTPPFVGTSEMEQAQGGGPVGTQQRRTEGEVSEGARAPDSSRCPGGRWAPCLQR